MLQASKNIFWLTVSRVLALGLLFIAYTQLFRYLGPYSSGQYQFALSYVTLFSVVVDFGISQYVVKKTSEEPNLSLKYFYNFLFAEIILVIFLYFSLSVIGLTYINDSLVFKAVLVAGFGMVVNGLTFPFLAVLSAFQDLRKVALINFINSVVNVSVILVAIHFNKSIVFLASQQMIFGVISLLLYRKFVRKHLPMLKVSRFYREASSKTIKQMLLASIPFAMLVGFSTVYNRIDVVLVTHIRGFTETGFYTAAYKFVDLMNFFPSVVSVSLYPAFAALISTGDIFSVRQIIEKYSKFLTALAIPMAMGVSVLSLQIIKLLAGPEFASSASALGVLSWAVALLIIYVTFNALIISQLTKKATLVTGLNIIVNVVGNLILLPKYGFIAAAYMTVVSELIQAVCYMYFVKKYITNYYFLKNLLFALLASFLMACVIWPVRHLGLYISVPMGAIFYVISLLLLGYFTKDDFVFMKRFISKKEFVKI